MFLKYNIWGILWVLLIFILCALPGRHLPPGPFFNFDKLVHFFFYATLQILLMRGFSLQTQFKFLQRNYLWFTAILSILYGIFIEINQGFILRNRTFDLYDIAANIVGVILGIIFWMIFPLKRIIKR